MESTTSIVQSSVPYSCLCAGALGAPGSNSADLSPFQDKYGTCTYCSLAFDIEWQEASRLEPTKPKTVIMPPSHMMTTLGITCMHCNACGFKRFADSLKPTLCKPRGMKQHLFNGVTGCRVVRLGVNHQPEGHVQIRSFVNISVVQMKKFVMQLVKRFQPSPAANR